MNFNLFEFFENFFQMLVNYANALWNVMQQQITIFGTNFTLLTLLPLVVGVGWLVWVLIKVVS